MTLFFLQSEIIVATDSDTIVVFICEARKARFSSRCSLRSFLIDSISFDVRVLRLLRISTQRERSREDGIVINGVTMETCCKLLFCNRVCIDQSEMNNGRSEERKLPLLGLVFCCGLDFVMGLHSWHSNSGVEDT